MTTLPVVLEQHTDLVAYDQDAAFQRFLQTIYNAPMLTKDEELSLAERFRTQQDVKAAYDLVMSHMRLVVKIAREYQGYKLPLPDLVQEGATGLMHAIKRFDPLCGARLATYALWWIRAAIHEFILRSWSVVKAATTQVKRRLFFKLRQQKTSLAPLSQEDVTTLAKQFGTDAKTIVEMDGYMGARDESLNVPANDNSGGEIINLLVDHRPNQEDQLIAIEEDGVMNRLIKTALTQLNTREQQIIKARHMEPTPKTLGQLSVILGISRERVRQLEQRALKKLEEYFQAEHQTMTAYSSATV